MKAAVFWAISIFLFANFAWVACINLWTAIRWYLHRKRGSMVPFIGGILGCMAVILVPLNGFGSYWWIPLFVDIGCVPFVLLAPVFFIMRYARKKKR